MKKPRIITVTQVLSSRKNPKWNYAKFWNMFTNKTTLEPCCLKVKPCGDCR